MEPSPSGADIDLDGDRAGVDIAAPRHDGERPCGLRPAQYGADANFGFKAGLAQLRLQRGDYHAGDRAGSSRVDARPRLAKRHDAVELRDGGGGFPRRRRRVVCLAR